MEQYSLRVESGRGFDLNVSLFERFVKAGYPHTTLELQHRMPPEVRRSTGLAVCIQMSSAGEKMLIVIVGGFQDYGS